MDQKMRIVCSQCGFESEDGNIEYCPICGKQIGPEDMVPVEIVASYGVERSDGAETELKEKAESTPDAEDRNKSELQSENLQNSPFFQPQPLSKKPFGKIIGLAALIILIFFFGQSMGKASARNSQPNESNPEVSASSKEESIRTESNQSNGAKVEAMQDEIGQTESASSDSVMVYSSAPSGNYTELKVTTASATSILEAESSEYHYEPYRAIDGEIITSWQEGAVGDGIGEELTIFFSKTEKVKYLCLFTGNWRDSERFYNNNRPAKMTITAGSEEYEVSFKDGMTRWFVVFDEPVETKSITFRIDSVYKGKISPDLCISEVLAYGNS